MEKNYLMRFLLSLLGLICLSLSGGKVYSQTILIPDANGVVYVKPGATGTGNGNSWANATGNLQAAINATGTKQVWVMVGTYDAPAGAFVMKNNVAIYGGFDPGNGIDDLTDTRIFPDTTGSTGTILSGNNLRRVINNNFTSTTVLDSTAVLDGFMITGGFIDYVGGGIFNNYASPTMTNLVIKGNTSTWGGGGMYNLNSSPVLSHSIVTGNTGDTGGGIQNENASPRITFSMITDNTANSGGGIYNFDASPIISNSSITNNTAALYDGGGFYNYSNSSPVLTNVAITGNSAILEGGGIYNQSGNGILTNVTIAGNTPQAFYVYGWTSWNNCIVYGGINGTNYTATYSIIQNSADTTDGNIDATGITDTDIFADPGNGDYTLKNTSPAINTGDNTVYVIAGGDLQNDKDLAGNDRLYDGNPSNDNIDMGAYEFQGEPASDGEITPGDPGNFITTWKTDNPGDSEYNQITIPIHQDGGYNFTIAWGDGNQTTWQDGDDLEELTHTYAASGTYTVEITGDFPRIHFDGRGDRRKILSIEQWGNIAWSSMEDAFNGASNLMGNATDAPDLSGVTSLVRMFQGASVFNGNIGSWDVSGVTNMSGMFTGANSFNQDIGSWNVSNVTNMDGMFVNAYAFNQDISGWQVGNVTNMNSMFRNAVEFNQDLRRWDVSKVTIMQRMLFNTSAFNVNIGNWDVSNVTDMFEMLSSSGLSPDNYDATLTGWAAQAVQNGIILGADGLEYCASASERQSLIDDHGWTITGDIQSADCGEDLNPDANNILYVDINVNTEATGYTGTGDSWANAVPQLQDALSWAADHWNGGADGILQIWVAAGTYYPDEGASQTDNDRSATFQLVNSVEVYGGFAGTETALDQRDWAVNLATLDGDIDQDGTIENNAYHVVTGSNTNTTPVLNGFTITGGHANGSSEKNGGGMYNFGGSSTLTNLIFKDNRADQDGGGMFNSGSSSVLRNVVFTGNQSDQGAGFFGQASMPQLINVTFNGNTAATEGGAITSGWNGTLELINVLIWGNEANGSNTSASASIDSRGGGITVSNSLIANSGGSDNWNVGIGEDGGNNVDMDPEFISTIPGQAGYLQPGATSPAVNGGNDDAYTNAGGDLENDMDLAGNPRVAGGTIDMGAYEFQEGTEPEITPDENNILYVDINVDTEITGYTATGDSWANALPQLADVLKWAREQHDGGSPGWNGVTPLRIFVAKGTYRPLYNIEDSQYTTDGGRDNAFVQVKDVQLYGGFDPSAGIETLEDTRILPDMNAPGEGSILSGDFAGNDNTDNFDNHIENTHHLIIGVGDLGSALIDGFRVTGGNANGTGRLNVNGIGVTRAHGGGMYFIEASTSLRHIIISNNSVTGYGGGLFSELNSDITIANGAITHNQASRGGGITSFHMLTLINAVVSKNVASLIAGGIENYEGILTITNGTISHNSAGRGGGIANLGAHTANLTNTVIWGNIADEEGNQLFNLTNGVNNLTLSHSLYADGDNDVSNNEGTIFDTIAVLHDDPLFADSANGDYSLSASSPAINMGSNTAYTDGGGDLADDVDLAYQLRLYDGIPENDVIDIGAYEFQGEPTPTIVSLSTPDTITVDYGTSLNTIENLPTEVTATLSDSTEAPVALDGNTGNWTLQEPEGGTYDEETAGTYVFTVPLVLPEPDDDLYFLNPDELQAEVTVTVARGIPELTASWNGTDIDPAAGLSLGYGDGGTLAFGSSNPDEEITYGFGENDTPVLNLDSLETVVAQQAGTATLTVQQAETDNFEAATLSFTVSVAPGAITIVPEAGQAKVYGEDDPDEYGYALAEGSELEEGDILSEIISGNSREEGEDTGTYDIILTFEGEKAANYDITFEEDNNAFVITPFAITVTAEDKSRVYGADDPELTYMVTPPLLGDDAFTGTLERETGETVGTYNITQGTLIAGNNYAITFEEGTFTITTADYEEITFSDGEFIYDGTEHSLAITGELPEGTSVTYQNNGRTDAGTQTVTAEIDGGENYEDMELTADLTINPLAITITADNQQKTYGTDDPELTYAADPLSGDDTFTGMLEREAGEAVGEYTITQGTLTAGNNYEIAFTGATLTITPADYESITFSDAEFIYDGTEHSLVITGELPEGTSVTYQNNGRTDAGTQTVTAEIDGGENYEDMELTADLTITPLAITITADNQQKAYGTDDPELTYAADPLIGDDSFTGMLEREAGEAVGEYAITQGTLTAGNNYEIAFTGATLTITPADYENITFSDAEFTYDGTEHILAITGELPEGTSVTYQNNGRTDAGTQTVIAEVNGGENYEDMELTADLTVASLAIMVTADNQQKTYGTDDPELTYTGDPLIGDDTFTGMLEREAGEVVGEYAIKQGTLTAGNNYEIAFTGATLTITPADYENITFSDAEFIYDGTEHILAITGELPEGISVTYQNNGRTDAGTQIVTAEIDGGDNYEDMELTAELTVNPLVITVTADDQEKVYGMNDPELTYTAEPLLGEDIYTGVLEREAGEAVGEYAITQGTLSAGDNYAIAFEEGTLTIAPADYENIVFNNMEFTYDGMEHSLTITGELPEGISVTYQNNSRKDVGTQTVTAEIDGGENYEDMELTAELTVNPLAIAVTADNQQKSYGMDDPELTYTAEPLLGEDIYTGILEREAGEAAGEYAITQGTLSAGDNYAIAFEEGTLTIAPADYENITLNDAEFTYDGTEHLLAITGELPEGVTVSYQNNGRTDAGIQTVTAEIDGGENYEDMELTATLTVHKASQEIVFDPITPQNLESTSGFSLEAYTTSGLSIAYSYTFDSTDPPATVTPDGEVTLLASGELTITAHQEGNENYLPAPPITRTLQISSGDASIRILHIAEKTYENPDPETRYLVNCDNMTNSVQVEIETETETNAVVTPGHNFTMDLPKPGIYTQEIAVTSEDGNATRTYSVIVERRFEFDDIVVQKFDNVLLVNNNPETNGGYEFVAYKWYKNGTFIGDGQYYSAGDNSTDLLDSNATYHAEMTTADGEVLQTCPMEAALQSTGEIIVYPNPVNTGNTINILANIPEEARKNVQVKVYSLSGLEIRRFHSQVENNTVEVSGIPPGVYILQYNTSRLQKSFKIIIN